MKIPEGYKKTELGILPKDWEVVDLKNICLKMQSGGTPKTTNRDYYDNGTIPFVKISDMTTSGKFITNTHTLITQNGLDSSSTWIVRENSILYTMYASVGFVSINKIKVATSQAIMCIYPDASKVSLEFLFYVLFDFKRVRSYIEKGTQGNLNANIIQHLKIPLPPLAEQEKIAEILSTWDTQIQNLESLIQEKQNLKKGLMQQLLSQTLRFKGFDGDWEMVALGEILKYEQPTQYLVSSTEYRDDFQIPVLTAGKTFILGYTNEKNGVCQNIPVILFDDFTTASQYVGFPFKVKSSACKILRLKNSHFSLKVIFELMQRICFMANDHKRYWISEYQHLKIPLPPLAEQEKIAEILSGADDEITLLAQKLESLKTQKKGLMQQLLSGKMRVKI